MRDPESPHRALLDHIGAMDQELSEAASHLQQTAQTYLTIASGKLDDENRIHPFQNLVSLFASALGAAIVDPAAASRMAFGTHHPVRCSSVRLARSHSRPMWNAYGSYRMPSRTA